MLDVLGWLMAFGVSFAILFVILAAVFWSFDFMMKKFNEAQKVRFPGKHTY